MYRNIKSQDDFYLCAIKSQRTSFILSLFYISHLYIFPLPYDFISRNTPYMYIGGFA